MRVLKIYNYIFYKIYKLLDSDPFTGWWSEYRAFGLICVLNLILITSVVFYIQYITRVHIVIYEGYLWIIYPIVGIIGFINYMLLLHNGKWRKIIKEFDKLDRKESLLWTIFAWSIIVGVHVSLFLSIFLMSKS